jgi:Na+-driven multidrug efflux pump
VISQVMTLVLSLHLLHHRYRLVAPPHLRLPELLRSWGQVLHIAGPSLVAFLLLPASMFIITGIVARYGEGAVAAFGAGGRIEMFAYLCPMALGISLAPLVGQNFGAARYDRVEEFRHWGERFALGWGAVIAAVFFLAAPWLARVFATDTDTQRYLVLYLRIMPFGYGMREVLRYLTIILNAISQPMASLKLNALFLAAFNVPFAIAGARLLDVAGIFIGITVGSNLAGAIALVYGQRHVTAAALNPATAAAHGRGS